MDERDHEWVTGTLRGQWQVHVFYDGGAVTDYNGVCLDGSEVLQISAVSALEIAEAGAQIVATGRAEIPGTVLAVFALDKSGFHFQGGEIGVAATRLDDGTERSAVLRIEPAVSVEDTIEGFDVHEAQGFPE